MMPMPHEWWELAKAWFQEKMQKILAAHRKDEVAYKKHLSSFKKDFPNFIYCCPNNIELSSLVHEVEEVEYSGVVKDTQ